MNSRTIRKQFTQSNRSVKAFCLHLLDDAIFDVDVLLQNAVIVHHSTALDEQSLLGALWGEKEGKQRFG